VTLPAWCTPGARVEFVDADWWPGVWTVGAEICAGHIEVSRGGAVVTCTPDDLRLVEAAPQPADVPPPADLDPHHRYLTAFDAVDAIGADLVLYDRRQPGAAAALELWAARRGKVVQYGDVEGWAGTLSVVVGLAGSPTSHEITVYLQG
jgi:hypothetical protein